MNSLKIIIIYFLLPCMLFGQSTFTPGVDYHFPPPPNAASLAKYAEYPVNKFNGTANISIPLYTITEGDLSVPISLNYHTGGIKVTEVASWVGLGWALNAGGSITRSVNGTIDEGGYVGESNSGRSEGWFESGNFWINKYKGIQNLCEDFYRLNGCVSSNNPADCDEEERSLLADQITQGKYDTKPDIFYLNLPGYSGKFYFNELHEIIVDPFDNIKIEYNHNPNLDPKADDPTRDYSRFTNFKVTLPDGTKYYFGGVGQNEQIKSALDRTYSFRRGGDILLRDQIVNTWHLVQIESVNSDYKIHFNYEKQSFVDLSFSGVESWGGTQAASDYGNHLAVTVTEDCRLESITSTHTNVDFIPKTNIRNDLLHDLYISPGVGFPDYGAPRLLDKIICKVNNSCVKEYELDHSDFPLGNQSLFLSAVTEIQNTSFDRKRPRLDVLKQNSCNTSEVLKHTFDYDTSKKLPSRLSFQQDHWGFHTPSDGSRIFPDLYYINGATEQPSDYFNKANYDEPDDLVPPQTNRYADENHSKAFMLKEITYPTGVKKEITTEVNTITKRRIGAGGVQPSGPPASNCGNPIGAGAAECCQETEHVELIGLSYSTLAVESNGVLSYPTVTANITVIQNDCNTSTEDFLYGYLVIKKEEDNGERQVFSKLLAVENEELSNANLVLALGVGDPISFDEHITACWWQPNAVYNIYLYKGKSENDTDREHDALKLTLQEGNSSSQYLVYSEHRVGGRRIKEIKEIDGDNTYTTQYLYKDVNNNSSGRLIDFPKYIFRSEFKPEWHCSSWYPHNSAITFPGGCGSGHSSDFVFRAMPVMPLGSTVGYSMGYSMVQEVKGGSGGNGKTISTFEADCAGSSENYYPKSWISEYFNTKIFPKNSKLLGKLKSERLLNEANQIVKETNFTYQERDFDTGVNKFFNHRPVYFCPTAADPELLIGYEETLPSSYVQLVEKEEIIDGIQTKTEFVYRDDKKHLNPVKTVLYRAGNELQTYYTHYPEDILNQPDTDLPSSLMNEMLLRNMINVVVKTESNGFENKGSKSIMFIQPGTNRMLPYRSMAYERTAWVEQSKLFYDNSDQFPDRMVSKFYEKEFNLEWNTPFNSLKGGLLKSQTYLNHNTEFEYNSKRLLSRKIELDDRFSNYEYDGFLRLENLKEYGELGSLKSETSYTYNIDFSGDDNYILSKIDFPDGKSLTTKKHFRPSGLELKTENLGYGPNGEDVIVDECFYNDYKQLSSKNNYQIGLNTFNYYSDPLNRLESETKSDGSKVSYEYGSNTNLWTSNTIIDENGNRTKTYKDLLGRARKIENENAGTSIATNFEYYNFGALKEVTTPMGFKYHYDYDNLGRLRKKDIPGQDGGVHYVYDSFYRLEAVRDSRSIVKTFGYDDYNRNTTTNIGSELVNTNYYDKDNSGIYLGKLWKSSERIVDNDSYGDFLNTEYEFDQFGRTKEELAENHLGGTDRIGYSYDFADNLKVSSKIHSGYSLFTVLLKYNYDHSFRLTDETIQVGAGQEIHIAQNAYNTKDQLTLMKIRGDQGSVLQNVDYQYNSRGWLTKINDINGYGIPLASCNSDPNPPCEGCDGGEDFRISSIIPSGTNFLIVDIRGGGEKKLDLNYPYNAENLIALKSDLEYWLNENEYEFEQIIVTNNNNQLDIIIQASEFEFNSLHLINGSDQIEELFFSIPNAEELIYEDDEYCNLCIRFGYDCATCPAWEILSACDNCPAFNPETLESMDCEYCDIGGQGVLPKKLELYLNPSNLVEEVNHIINWDARSILFLPEGKSAGLNPNGVILIGDPFAAIMDEAGTTLSFDLPEFIIAKDNQEELALNITEKIYSELVIVFKDLGLLNTDVDSKLGILSEEISLSFMNQVTPFAKVNLKDFEPEGTVSSSSEIVDLFNLHLNYSEGPNISGAPRQYNGNISGMTWQAGRERKQNYGLTYDGLDRLLGARYYDFNSSNNWSTDQKYSAYFNYDDDGNFTTLERNGPKGYCSESNPSAQNYGQIDDLSFEYNGYNRLANVNDASLSYKGFLNGAANYSYDKSGNLIQDSGKGMEIERSFLNLPGNISFNFNDSNLGFLYTANGRKLQKLVMDRHNVHEIDYVDNIEYEDGQLAAIHHSQGRVIPDKFDSWRYQFHLTDHLGNIRVLFEDKNKNGTISIRNPDVKSKQLYVADDSEIMSIYHYYPFGMRIETEWSNGWDTNYSGRKYDYTYNGKELNEDFGLDWLDYGARFYDASIGRWNAVDPLAESMSSWSPYNYTFNNPVRFIDPDGRAPDWIPSVNDNGDIVLTAEAGDNASTLIDFFGGEENASQYVDQWALNENIQYSEGNEVALKEDNPFSLTMKYYHKNSEAILNNLSYDCKELCRQLVLNETSIEHSLQGSHDMPRSMIREFGEDWAKKQEIDQSGHQFGKTFSYWSWTNFPVGDHAAIYFGQDKGGTSYWFSKNGIEGPLKITTMNELSKSFNLWNVFRTDYKKK